MTLPLFNRIIDLIWPPLSLLGDDRVKINGTIDFEHWQKIQFNYGEKCYCCGIKITDAPNPQTLCGECLAETPHYDTARAPILYDENSKPLILNLKHGGRKEGLKTFATMMRDAAFEIENSDLIIPVPIHKKRLLKRGFNQSVWLGGEISKITNIPFDPFILIRTKDTKSQNGLSNIGRKNNMQGAFKTVKDIKDKNIILIDDVFTTGATVNSCARVLKRAGAKRVDVITLMRVNHHDI